MKDLPNYNLGHRLISFHQFTSALSPYPKRKHMPYIAVGPLTSSTYFFSQKMLGDELRAIAIIVLVTLQTIFFTHFFSILL